MAKKLIISLLSIILIVTMLVGVVACKKDDVVKNDFELIEGSDNSIPRMPGDMTAAALAQNPDRGFSFEAFLRLDNVSKSYRDVYAFPEQCSHPEHSIGGRPITALEFVNTELNKYKELKPQVVELTVYLTDFIGTDISDTALNQLYDFIREVFRNNGISVILKFAYQHEAELSVKPTVDNIVTHMNKLNKWFGGNSSLIKSSVSAVRMSFIGKDGNFYDHGYSDDDVKILVNAFHGMIPTIKKYNVYSQAPNVKTKNLSDNYAKQITTGYFNDNLDSELNAFSSGGTDKNSEIYKQYVYQSMSSYNSVGVVPNKANIDGKAVLKTLKDGYFNTFNLSQMFAGDESTRALIDVWKSTIITKKELSDMGLPYYDEWFTNSDGTSANRSVFDYIRDFVGYNLSITNLKFEYYYKNDANGASKYHTRITFTITNYGMAAPLHIDKFEVFLKSNATGKMLNGGNPLTYVEYDPTKLTCGGQINITQEVIGDINVAEGSSLTAEQKAMGHSIGVRIYQDRSPRDLYVRLSNNVPYENNINWIYSTMNR